ncbi:MAG: AAA family ATPase [Candidatus Dormibacteria bacterium]
MANPFQFGRAVQGDQFTDREEPLRVVTTLMREGQNAILVSPRRYGKTSLLKTAVRAVDDAGGHAAMVDLMLCSDRRAVADEVRRALLPLSQGWLGKRLAQWRELVSRRVPHLAVTLEHGGYETSFRPVARDYDWGEAIAATIDLMAELGTRDAPVALVIDEFQKIAGIDSALAGVFKAIVDRTRGMSLVFSGSRRHLMHDLFTGDGAPLKGTGMVIALDLIARADMVPFLTQRAAGAGKMMSEQVAETLFDAAHGIPNTVQLFAFWAYQEAGRRIDEASLARGIGLAVDAVAPELAVTFSELSPVQQRIVLTLAREGTIAHPFEAASLTRFGVTQPATVSKALHRLENNEVAWSTARGWQLVNAAFEQWLLRDPG